MLIFPENLYFHLIKSIYFYGIRWNLRFNIFSELSQKCAHAHAGHTQQNTRKPGFQLC